MGNIFNFHGNVNMNVYCKKCTITEEPDSGCGLEINSIGVDFNTGFIFELTNTSGTHVGAVITTNDVPVDMGCQETTSQYIISLDNANTLFSGLTIVFTSYSDDCQTSTCEVIIPISFSQLEIPVSGENTIFELNGEPVCTEDSSYSIVLAGPNSIVMNNTNGNLTIPAQEIDSNGPGGVYIYYYICGGEVVYFMGVFMANPQGPQQMYSCDGNTCIEDENGQYDHSSCYGNCNGGPTMYSCDNGNCIENVEGEYNNNNCDNECTLSYTCDGLDCIEDENGEYDNSDCDFACVPPTMYSCIDDNCVEDEEGIYDEPTCFGGECYVAPVGLRMLFDDIVNAPDAPVVDPTNVGQWNAFYDLPTNGTPFTSAWVSGNQVTLVGGGAMTFKDGAFSGSTSILEVHDDAGVVVLVDWAAFINSSITDVTFDAALTIGEVNKNGSFLGAAALANVSMASATTFLNTDAYGAGTFFNNTSIVSLTLPSAVTCSNSFLYGATSLQTFSAPNMTTMATLGMTLCTSATLIDIPLCVNLGTDPTDASVFDGITGQTITLNIAAVNATNNAGGVHASVAYLIANNTATVNYI
jgi:hypothetical protein